MRRQNVTCFRVYDADLPDYAFAIDLYEEANARDTETTGGRRARRLHAHVQEYAAPPEIDPAKAQARLRAALRVIPEVLQLEPRNVHLKVRRRQRGAAQYERQSTAGRFFEVHEGELRFFVNLTDFLDTGLFLDGRLTRALLRDTARGAHVLNLFSYTGAATVAAGKGGAASTTSVDLSRTYLDWARRNLELNKLKPSRNRLVQADALEWIGRPHDGSPDAPREYDLVYLDPPTFSNSKRMGRATFDAARDHADLIRVVARRLLRPGGTLLFAEQRAALPHGGRGPHFVRPRPPRPERRDAAAGLLPLSEDASPLEDHLERLKARRNTRPGGRLCGPLQ